MIQHPLTGPLGDLKFYTILVGPSFTADKQQAFVTDIQHVFAYTDEQAIIHIQNLLSSTTLMQFEIKKAVPVKDFLKFLMENIEMPETSPVQLLNNLAKAAETLFETDTEQRVFKFAIKKIKKLYENPPLPRPRAQ